MMVMALMTASILLGVVGLVGAVWLLIEAFRVDVVQGLLCLFLPFYIYYFAFARLDSRFKGTILGLWLGAGIPSVLLFYIGLTIRLTVQS